MDIRIVCIGTELLIGHTVNTNLAFIGQALEDEGYEISREVCIPDNPPVMREVFRRELNEGDVLITVGGLGPTRDDLTRDVAAEIMGCDMAFDQSVYDHIAVFLNRRGVKLRSEALRVQSMVPIGATAMVNINGTAPGLWCPVEGKIMVLLPGPPRELQPMFEADVLPRLRALGRPLVARRSLQVCGVPESVVEERVDRVLEQHPGLEPAYCARPFFVDIRLSAASEQAAELDEAADALRREFADDVLEAEHESIVHSLAAMLTERNWKLAVAESCTGGGIGAELTSVSGSSAWFAGGFITYSNECKMSMLGVDRTTLEDHGAVSEETAREMVAGVIENTGADCAIAVTGIAGPGGGTAEKPVGLVYIAIAAGGNVHVLRRVYPGNRQTVRDRAKSMALVELRRALRGISTWDG